MNITPTSIVLISQARLGDTLFNTPALRLLKTAYPEARIDVIAPTPLAAQVWANSPLIDSVHLCKTAADATGLNRYDLAVAAYSNEYSRGCSEQLADTAWLKHEHHAVPPAVDFLNYLKKQIPTNTDIPVRYDLFPGEEHRALVAEKLEGTAGTGPVIGCQIACHGVNKSLRSWFKSKQHPKVWPPKYYRRFFDLLLQAHPDARILLVGSDAEAQLADKLSRREGIYNFAGLDIPSLKVLIEHCDLFVSPDTGPMHVACTTDTPLIAMFSKTSPDIYGPPPGRPDSTVLQGDPITTIKPEAVLTAAQAYLLKEKTTG